MADTKKTTNPKRIRTVQTVRQRSEKTEKEAAKPRRFGKTRHALAWPFVKIGHGLAWIGRFKPLRFIGRILFPRYFRNAVKELRQVTWPGRKQSRQLTSAVIVFAVIFGVLIALVDFGLDKVFKKVILKQ